MTAVFEEDSILDPEVVFSQPRGLGWGGSPLEGAWPSASRSSLWGEQVITYAASAPAPNQAASRACRARRVAP